MLNLKRAIDTLDEVKFSEILSNDILDSEEVLMLLYVSVVCFHTEKAFDILIRRNNFFKFKPEWYSLFSSVRIF